MTGLSSLRHRIISIEKTQKITYAMRLVAMSLYNRVERKKAEISPFLSSARSYFKLISQHRPIHEQLRIGTTPIEQSELIIIVTSSKGLCGSFHESLRKFLKTRFKNDGSSRSCIAIGTKTHQVTNGIFSYKNTPLSYDALTTKNVISTAQEIIEHIYQKNYKSVRVFSNRFINFFSYKPAETILYPLSNLSESDAKEQTLRHIITHTQKGKLTPQLPHPTEIFEFEQPFQAVEQTIISHYGLALLTHLLLDSLLAEHSARFVSMDAATKNASSVIEKLKNHYNKLRQAGITKEVAELSRSL